jgi:hypothetical protein
MTATERVLTMTALGKAITIVGGVRAERLLAGDRDTAARLAELIRLLDDEREYVEGIEKHDLSMTNRDYPPGVCVGWFWRHDPHVRQLRRLRGLHVPEASDG